MAAAMHEDDEAEFAQSVRDGKWYEVAEFLKKGVRPVLQKWAVRESSSRAAWLDIQQHIVPHCTTEHLEIVSEHAVERKLWCLLTSDEFQALNENTRRRIVEEFYEQADIDYGDAPLRLAVDDQLESLCKIVIQKKFWRSASKLLNRNLSDTQRRSIVDAAMENCEDENLRDEIISCCADDQIERSFHWALEKKKWFVLSDLMKRGVDTGLRRRAIEKACLEADDGGFYDIVQHTDECQLIGVLMEAAKRGDYLSTQALAARVARTSSFSEMLYIWGCSFLYVLRGHVIRDFHWLPVMHVDDCSDIWASQEAFFSNLSNDALLIPIRERKEFERLAEDVATVLQRVGEENQIDFGIKAEVLQKLLMMFFEKQSLERSLTEWAIVPLFALQCLNTVLKSAAVRHLVIYCRMHTDGWKVFDVICSLSGVWEEVRRWALKEAIDKKQWQAVKGFIDTNLYDDQRESALRAALREKQMDVVAALAEFGLTDDVLMLVHSQVALHADWDTFLQLCERGVSVRFVRQDLESASVRREGHPSKEATDRYNRRLDQVRNLERQVSKDARSFSVAVAKNNWPAIFLHLQNDTNREKVDIALKAALENHAYHVVVHLVKHAMDVTQRNSLFPEAIRRRLWGVGRALLERDVNVELCQAALPELLKHSQWVLVARIVEHADIDDSERRKVIDVAMASREESLVLHCISTLTVEMSVMDRDTLFEKALAEDLWRVVMRLVEEKDAVGISQRDTALLTAVERNRWDEADHCQRHGADIDMKDSEGHSLIQQAARKRDWQKVEGLLKIGADQFPLDNDGYSVLHTAVSASLPVLELLIQFHGNINQPGPSGRTPLQSFILNRQIHLIDVALLWGRDVTERDEYGNTALHAVCAASDQTCNLESVISCLVARGCEPLAVNRNGQTMLCSAINQGSKYTQRSRIGECIKLGVTTYQPYISFLFNELNLLSRHDILRSWFSFLVRNRLLKGPFYDAFNYRQDFVTLYVLYESGSPSSRDIIYCYRTWCYYRAVELVVTSGKLTVAKPSAETLLKHAYLKKIATNPRRLESKCRLMISHIVGVWKKRERERRVMQLPILSDEMKDFVLFSDLLDPDLENSERYKSLMEELRKDAGI
ncbi:hypothetical protein BaRGS_00021577 [Batillaria attramentaria]|uniref:Uncharacterized protein n=1 Tax=Batillaria attramentaria TaxID=370345 RepID=A0ABD0KKB7_9CAEN